MTNNYLIQKTEEMFKKGLTDNNTSGHSAELIWEYEENLWKPIARVFKSEEIAKVESRFYFINNIGGNNIITDYPINADKKQDGDFNISSDYDPFYNNHYPDYSTSINLYKIIDFFKTNNVIIDKEVLIRHIQNWLNDKSTETYDINGSILRTNCRCHKLSFSWPRNDIKQHYLSSNN